MQSDILAKACEEANMPIIKFIVRAGDGSIELQEVPSKPPDPVPDKEAIRESHQMDNNVSNAKPKFKLYSVRKRTKRLHSCVECNELFANAYALKCHNSKTHTEKRLHPCLECGLQFETPFQLQDHLVAHLRSKKYTCPVCKEGFSNYSHLSEHLKMHSSQKQYLCDMCGMEFAYECNLKRHELIHNAELNRLHVPCDKQNSPQVLSSATDDEVKNLEVITVLFEDDNG